MDGQTDGQTDGRTEAIAMACANAVGRNARCMKSLVERRFTDMTAVYVRTRP